MFASSELFQQTCFHLPFSSSTLIQESQKPPQARVKIFTFFFGKTKEVVLNFVIFIIEKTLMEKRLIIYQTHHSTTSCQKTLPPEDYSSQIS